MRITFIIIFSILFIVILFLIIFFRNYNQEYIETLGKQKSISNPVLGFSSLCVNLFHKIPFIKHSRILSKKRHQLASVNTGIPASKLLYEYHLKIASYTICIFILLSFLGLIYSVSIPDSSKTDILEVTRPAHDSGDQSISLKTDSDIYSGIIDISIEEEKRTFDEVMNIFTSYRDDFDAHILGDNTSFLHITYPLNFPSTWGDENISVSWSISDTKIIDYSGNLISDNISPYGSELEIIATLTLDDISADICYTAKVFPPSVDLKESLISYIDNYINSESNSTLSTVPLPDNINGMDISFYTESTVYPPWLFIIAAITIPIAVIIIEKNNLDKKVFLRNEQLLLDYPELVSKFSLLILAGLSISRALQQISDDYAESRKNGGDLRYAFEEITLTCQALRNGVFETIAYEEMGQRFGLPCYIKFSSLLISGLRRGTADFNRLLAEEATASILERKASILQKGERASSKLIGPMMILFIVILVLIMIPALLSINV